jgi:hypothetical protein
VCSRTGQPNRSSGPPVLRSSSISIAPRRAVLSSFLAGIRWATGARRRMWVTRAGLMGCCRREDGWCFAPEGVARCTAGGLPRHRKSSTLRAG